MRPRSRRLTRLFKRIVESCAFWVATFNAFQCLYFAFEATLDARAFFTHHVHVYAFGNLEATQDAFLRAIVWLWLLQWAEKEDESVSVSDASV